jgi:hypothetical protein
MQHIFLTENYRLPHAILSAGKESKASIDVCTKVTATLKLIFF